MTTVDRRKFLRDLGGAAFAPSLVGLAACTDPLADAISPAHTVVKSNIGGYGDLNVDPDCPELLIPPGFRCVKLSETLQPSKANPSFIVPQALDGMAAYGMPNPDRIRLVRNHEIRDNAGVAPPFGGSPYDPLAGAGTTTLEVKYVRDPNGGLTDVEVVAEWPSLTGTLVNCAGGPTPWRSWLTCEETTSGVSQGYGAAHGYVFEVPADANRVVRPRPLKALGRFVHEAVAVDPATGIVYLTEDRSWSAGSTNAIGSGFFRFIPRVAGLLHEGGRLQVLKIRERNNFNTVLNQTPGRILPVEWVDIDNPDPAEAETDPSAVFREGYARGAAFFQRLEGCWYGDNSIFFNATSGGNAGLGQVWQYRPISADRGQLILVFESPDVSILDSPDNIAVSPRGGIVLCEDGGGEQYIRGLTQQGNIFDFVRTNGNLPEFAGATFDPKGEVLFFNIQGSTSATGTVHGGTYAIWGPWDQGAL